MKLIKNILMFVLFATVTCGLVASKSIAYCCGMCHTEVQENSCCDEQTSCCSSENTEEADHDCKKDPCRVAVIQFDWNSEIVSKTVTPSIPVLDLFSENYSLKDLLTQISEVKSSQVQPHLLISPSPREYLSFLNILII